MDMLQLVEADGLETSVEVIKNCGEYYYSCPGCNGKDQLIIWDTLDRYYCKQCLRRGGPVQYLRDFHNLSYYAACHQLGLECKPESSLTELWRPMQMGERTVSVMPSPLWNQEANRFIKYCHRQLMNNPSALQLLYEQGFTLGTIQLFQLGWNPETIWIKKNEWGLYDRNNKELCIPQGLVIATFDVDSHEPIKIKICRDLDQIVGRNEEYIEISENISSLSVYGSIFDRTIIVLESEIDAMLVHQYAGDVCCCIALGKVSRRPDYVSNKLLTSAPLVLFSLDNDYASAAAFQWWSKMYPKLFLWPSPIGKSPGDALRMGLNIRKWIVEAIYLHKNLTRFPENLLKLQFKTE